MFIRILFIAIIFVLTGQGDHTLPVRIQHQEKAGLQLASKHFGLPASLTADNQYLLDREDDDYKEQGAKDLSFFPDPGLLFLLHHLFAEPSAITLNPLREKEISAAYTTPRYILHRNLRIPSC
ncbi:hypothetical protein [Pedobacter cryoconitis]|uniref:Uncharacterized protein n=1 Tax=Pedobacter cryoconitis TaxID=188932 RepID=A0A7X0J651_9SPHI|nr:hypothetical protein [Pedobacter cryoconitis]MBB6501067.1 hypothetical protein [Pedobacter cryoconitis]